VIVAAVRRSLMIATAALLALAPCPGRAPGAPLTLEPSRAPAFKIRAVSGETLTLDKLAARGPLVLDFWATWCRPCLAELPELEALFQKYRERGLTVVAVSLDGPRNFAKVRPFASKLGLTFPIAVDEDGRMQQLYQVRAMPTTVVIDTAGMIVAVHEGYRPGDTRGLEAEIEKLFAPPQVAAPKQ
jgi:cytochrome c biogenesis protein CcmG, thiol:disulfide interchange protein DsbE